ncbi:MAG: hypothetical protein WC337_10695 [Candidatus Muiribacteriota bacterium]
MIYKLIWKSSKLQFIFFLCFAFFFLSVFFFIVSLLEGYGNFITENLFINSFHINADKKDGRLFSKEEIIELKNKIDIQNISSILPHSSSQALIRNNDYYTGANIFGFDYKTGDSPVEKYMVNGDFAYGDVVAGIGFKKVLGLETGDYVEFSNIEEKMSFRVSGFFETGIYDIDYYTIFMDINDFNVFFLLPDGFKNVGISLNKLKNTKKIAAELRNNFQIYNFSTVYESNRALISALNMEKLISLIISAIILMLFFGNIWLFFVSKINYQKKEFAYVIADGTPRKTLVNKFYVFFLTSFTGVYISSSIISYILINLLDGKISIPAEIYFVDKLHLKFDNYFFVYLTCIFLVFNLIIYFMFKSYFNKIDIEKELR